MLNAVLRQTKMAAHLEIGRFRCHHKKTISRRQITLKSFEKMDENAIKVIINSISMNNISMLVKMVSYLVSTKSELLTADAANSL